ncbi:MAG: exodeoxyribonuclease VII large subunit, partial [Candidatus Curtissbacteria bacterium]|nr:exodeoxyribonuclease VII large subunit [Candidatus Curtissbacteria bacterium]
ASTPTDAAHIVTSGYGQALDLLEGYKYKLKTSANYYFSNNFQTLDHVYLRLQYTKNIFKDLPHKLNAIKEILRRHEKQKVANAMEKTESNLQKLGKSAKNFSQNQSYRLDNLSKSLFLLSPQNTLKRGYSITTDKNGTVLRSVGNVVVGSTIGIKLADGRLSSTVKAKSNN